MHRLLTLTAAVIAALLVVAAPAAGSGVADVELDVLDTQHGEFPTVRLSDERPTLQLRLRNLADEPRSVRVYATEVLIDDTGQLSLGRPGTPSWAGLPATDIDLDPGARHTLQIDVDRTSMPPEDDGERRVAFVLEANSGTTVVTRAATVVLIAGPRPSLIVLPLALLATGLLAGAAYLLRRYGFRGSTPTQRPTDRAVIWQDAT